MSDELINMDLRFIFWYFVRRIWIVLILTIIAAGGIWYYLKQHPTYQSRAILSLLPVESFQVADQFDSNDLVELARSGKVMQETQNSFNRIFHYLPYLKAELFGQKKLVLTGRGKNKDWQDAKEALALWIFAINVAYEEDYKYTLLYKKTALKMRQKKIDEWIAAIEKSYADFISKDEQLKNRNQTSAIKDFKKRMHELELKTFELQKKADVLDSEMSELKKMRQDVSSRLLQIDLSGPSNRIKVIQEPTQPVVIYSPLRYGVIAAILTFGLVGGIILVAGVFARNKRAIT